MTNPASYTTSMFRLLVRSVSFALALAVTSACGNDSVTIPTTPTPDPITETFSGTLTPNGAATHTFSSSASGSVSATLAAVGPDDTIVMGLALGTWNGTGCAVIIANDTAVQTAVIYGNVTQAGQLCVRAYDVGRFTEPTNYEISVVHP